MPRAPTPPATVKVVESLVAQGNSDYEVASQATLDGHPVSRATVQRIRRGQHLQKQAKQHTGKLNPGEQRVDGRKRCKNGHLITVEPCRTCELDAWILAQSEPPDPPGRPG